MNLESVRSYTARGFWILSFLALAGLIFSFIRSGPADRLGLVAYPERIDLGLIEAADTTICNRWVSLRNDSDKNIIITGVKVSCGCTIASISPGAIIPAGKTLPVHVSLSVDNRYGPIRSTILILGSKIGEKGDIKAIIKLNAVSMMPAIIEPPDTMFRVTSTANVPLIGHLRIEHGNSKKYQWDDVEVEANNINVIDKSVTNAGVEISFEPKLQTNVLGGGCSLIHFYLLKNEKRINYAPLVSNVTWEVVNPDLNISPSMVYLGAVHRNEIAAGKIAIRTVDHEPITYSPTTVSESNIGEIAARQVNADCIQINYKMKINGTKGNVSFLIKNHIILDGVTYELHTPIIGYILD